MYDKHERFGSGCDGDGDGDQWQYSDNIADDSGH